jgi:hypothetical protein
MAMKVGRKGNRTNGYHPWICDFLPVLKPGDWEDSSFSFFLTGDSFPAYSPAGWGDVAIGIAAPLVALYWKRPFPYKSFVVWNVLGLLDLAMAVSLGILASGTPVGVLAGKVTTRLMGMFPLSLIPTFFVPLLMILHLISLSRIGRRVPSFAMHRSFRFHGSVTA